MENLFAERLKEARLRANMNMADLAKKTGLTASAISSYETTDEAKNKAPSLPNAMKLAQALGVSLEWLSGFDTIQAASSLSYEAIAANILNALDILENYAGLRLETKIYAGTVNPQYEVYMHSGALFEYVDKMKTVDEAIKVSHLDDEMATIMRNKVREDYIKVIAKKIENNSLSYLF